MGVDTLAALALWCLWCGSFAWTVRGGREGLGGWVDCEAPIAVDSGFWLEGATAVTELENGNS